MNKSALAKMHVTSSPAVGIQTPGKCLSLLHAGEPCAFVQTIKCDEFFVCTGFIVHFRRCMVHVFRHMLY